MSAINPGAIPARLGDFTANRRLLGLSVVAIAIGAIAALVATALLQLIALCTSLFWFQRADTIARSPADNTLGLVGVAVPILGALIIGVMARYGSERIRGHGIPEALEAILIRGSRVEPRVALLKPVSAAISIGSGGPFGAEGPIIMTGGAVGSLIAQAFHLTAAERKTLLVAGAAAGMSATFAAPLAAVLLAVELLLFELKPRSLVPVALASATAAVLRHVLLGDGPLFQVPAHHLVVDPAGIAGCVVMGLGAGGLAALMTVTVYAAEDAFARLRLHWMWWPALGGVVVGIGGLVCPRALGVGYENIEALLGGAEPWQAVLLLLVVKWTIWAVALGSGTSGGVLAPLLMLGASLGALAGFVLPDEGAGFWPLVAMGACLGGMMRSPLTGVVFAVELTHAYDVALPLLVASVVAHGFTVLVMRRSVLTEKVARRGYHVTREYAVDPLDVLFVRDVMSAHAAGVPVVVTDVVARADELLREVVQRMAETGHTEMAVVDDGNAAIGTVTLAHMLKARQRHAEEEQRRERVWTLPGRWW